ncbi:hypothetical protein [Sphingobacterium alkalisoli]|nr:hypothetical protein [Sphingobacterium alkalisoli]
MRRIEGNFKGTVKLFLVRRGPPVISLALDDVSLAFKNTFLALDDG